MNTALILVYEQFGSLYNLYIHDGLFLHNSRVESGTPDYTDFVDNYLGDASLCSQTQYSAAGYPIFQTTPRPLGTTTFFSGAGDNGSPANGPELMFNLSSTDTSKQIEIEFIEDVHMKDGVIRMENAPLGSYIDVEIVDPVDGVVGAYLKKVPLLGTGRIDFNTDDQEIIQDGLKVRVTVYNSDGTGDKDAAAAFKVIGFFEMYRATTV